MKQIHTAKPFRLGLLALSLAFVTSCEEDLDSMEKTIELKETQANRQDKGFDAFTNPRNKDLEKVARKLAKSLDKKKLRGFIKDEALKKFDGDFDILYSTVKNKKVDGVVFSEHLNHAAAEDNITHLAAQEPLLNISIPVNIEKWDTENFIPLVAVRTVDFDEEKDMYIKAYDSKGKVHLLNAKEAPDFPVIVVGLNERVEVDENGELKSVNNYVDVNTNGSSGYTGYIVAPQEPGYGGGGGGGTGGGGTVDNCGGESNTRVDKKREWLKGINCTDLNEYESWHFGAPELRLRIYHVKISNKDNLLELVSKPYKPGKRSDINDTWWDTTDKYYDLFFWDKSFMSTNLLYYWTEEDYSTGLEEITITLAPKFEVAGVKTEYGSISAKFKIGGQDKVIGKTVVSFEDRCEQFSIGSYLFFRTGQF